jgi:hypothetical protein
VNPLALASFKLIEILLAVRYRPSVAMILFTHTGDVDVLSLRDLLGQRPPLSRNRQRHQTQERWGKRKRRKRASHREPPERKDYVTG